MRFENGYLQLFRVAGIPVRAHWATPLGAFVLGRFQFVPGFWLGFLLLILLHEVGHAIVVRAVRAHVIAIELNPIGGVCRYTGWVSPMHGAMIAWGGVWMQLAVFVVAVMILLIAGSPTSNFFHQLAWVFTETNLIIAALNLLPIAPLDGAEAWKLVPMLRARWRARQEKKKHQSHVDRATREAEEEIARLDRLEDELDEEERKKKKNGHLR